MLVPGGLFSVHLLPAAFSLGRIHRLLFDLASQRAVVVVVECMRACVRVCTEREEEAKEVGVVIAGRGRERRLCSSGA